MDAPIAMVTASVTSDIAELIDALSTFVWAALILALALIFRPRINALIDRVRRVKAPGLDLKLDRLGQMVDDLAEQAPIEELASETTDGASLERVVDLAARSPRAALIEVRGELERAVRRYLAMSGGIEDRHGQPSLIYRPVSLRRGIETILRRGPVPSSTLTTVDEFLDLSSTALHGEASEDEILRAVEVGLRLLALVRSLPLETKTVKAAGIPLYGDAECTIPIDGTGVLLEMSSGDSPSNTRLFPTTKTYFAPGQEVSWEWNPDLQWGEAWYVSEATGEQPEYAWTSSMEFVGRPVDELVHDDPLPDRQG
jgi:hypothetical protein